MINEIIIQLPKKDNHIWLLHLWEHCVVRNFEHKLIQYGLDDQGIIVNGSTFLDSTTIEIYYSINDLKDNILSIVRKVIKDIPVDMIKREISIISDEINYIDINDEEKIIYDGLKITESDNILNLYDHLNLPIEVIIQKFSNLMESVKIANFSEDKLTFETSSFLVTNEETSSFALSKNSVFLSCDIKIKITDPHEYLIGYFLAFMIGMTEDSIIQKKYLAKNNKYLGYTQYIMYNNNAHILSLLDIKNIDKVFIKDILQEAIFTNMTDKDFKRQLNAFKTYVGLYVSRYDFCKDLLKCCEHQTQLSFSNFLSFIDTINIKDVQSLYQRIQYDIKEI